MVSMAYRRCFYFKPKKGVTMIKMINYMLKMMRDNNLRRLYRKISYRDAVAVWCNLFFRL